MYLSLNSSRALSSLTFTISDLCKKFPIFSLITSSNRAYKGLPSLFNCTIPAENPFFPSKVCRFVFLEISSNHSGGVPRATTVAVIAPAEEPATALTLSKIPAFFAAS